MYKILELVVLGANPAMRFKLNEVNGLYNRITDAGSVITTEEPQGLNDLIFGRLMKITKVKRTTDNVVFSIGTPISQNVTIGSFNFVKNVIKINNALSLSEAIIYVPPVVTPVATTNDLAAMEAIILRDNRPIKLGCASAPFNQPTESLTSFLKNFILTYNNENNSNYCDTNRMQTEAGRRRSLGDIFMICKNYYPTCTLRDVIQALYVDLVTLIPNLGSLICGEIHKRVWWLYTQPRFSSPENNDEYGHNKQWYLDQLAIPVETVVEEEQPSANMTLFNKIKTTFKPGVKFKIMSTGKVAKVSSTEFYNGIGKILIINGDGKRLIVYDKVKNKQAEIVR